MNLCEQIEFMDKYKAKYYNELVAKICLKENIPACQKAAIYILKCAVWPH
jgi:hypothetical protein